MNRIQVPKTDQRNSATFGVSRYTKYELHVSKVLRRFKELKKIAMEGLKRKGTLFKCLKFPINTNQVKFWFLRRGETGVPGESLSVQSREPTNSTHIRRRIWESNPGHIGGKLSPLRHPCTPFVTIGRGTIKRTLAAD